MLPVKIALGGASLGTGGFAAFHDPSSLTSVLELFSQHGQRNIDTARRYPAPNAAESSEALIGRTEASKEFIIDTKIRSVVGIGGGHEEGPIRESVRESLQALGRAKVHVLYLHAPDRATPFATTFRVMNVLYEEGIYEKLGLSNYTADDVDVIVELCKSNAWVIPSVYQGQYNAFARRADTDLFPVLRKHSIAFVAYSPLAAGFFTGKHSNGNAPAAGTRFAVVPYLKDGFLQPSFAEALRSISTLTVPAPALALRWLVFHSPLAKEFSQTAGSNMIILGGSRIGQLEENLNIIRDGPLEAALVSAVEAAWQSIKGDSLLAWQM